MTKSEKFYYSGLAIGSFLFFAYLQFGFPHALGDPDAYYHAGMAKLISGAGELRSFPWLWFTTWHKHFVDQHFLYHVLLIPFNNLKTLPWSIVLFSTASLTTLFWTLRVFKLRGSFIWTILFLFGSIDFLFRISIVKANTLSLVFLFAALIILKKNRPWWLLPLSFFFVWTYGGFVFLPIIIGIYILAELYFQGKLIWQPFFYCILGVALGILFHPQASNVIYYLYTQIWVAGLGARSDLAVGVEWQHYTFTDFLQLNTLIALSYTLALLAFFKAVFTKKLKNSDKWTVIFFLLSLFFLAFALKSRRFMEYFLPFTILFEAAVFTPFLTSLKKPEILHQIKKIWQTPMALLIVSILIFYNAVHVTKAVANYLIAAPPESKFLGVSNWLKEHAAAKTIVFNTRWDEFPQLFYYNQNNYYIIGLDPTFMYIENHDRYNKWRAISDDRVAQLTPSQLHDELRNDFQSGYIILENRYNPGLRSLLNTGAVGSFKQVFSDGIVSLYSIE